MPQFEVGQIVLLRHKILKDYEEDWGGHIKLNEIMIYLKKEHVIKRVVTSNCECCVSAIVDVPDDLQDFFGSDRSFRLKNLKLSMNSTRPPCRCSWEHCKDKVRV